MSVFTLWSTWEGGVLNSEELLKIIIIMLNTGSSRVNASAVSYIVFAITIL